MKPTEILSQEHKVILRVLTCLERMLNEGETEGHIDGPSAKKALEFFSNFADGCHHGKEEDYLFPKLIECGIPRHGGPIAVMLSEHDLGRKAMQGMLWTLDSAAEGNAAGLQAFTEWGHRYFELLRDHIAKEDRVLFPMAANFLNEEAQQLVLDGFEKAESAHEPGLHLRMLNLANELCERYSVEAEELDLFADATHGGCMQHGCGG